MKILSAASALPPNYYPQQVLLDAFKAHWGERLGRLDILDRLHSATRVDGRYLALPIEAYLDMKRWGEFNNVWIRVAQELGEKALSCALQKAGLTPKDVNALYFVSVTGIASPSIDALLVNRMGLNPHVKRNPIFGLGCVAGAAGIGRASDFVKAYPDQVAALVSVELCSLTLQQDDVTVANLISAGLFGDGAAAVIVAGIGESRQPEWPGNSSHPIGFLPEHRTRDGLGHLGKGLQHRALPGSARRRSGEPGSGCRLISCRPGLKAMLI